MKCVRTSREDAVLTVVIDRAPANAFDDKLSQELGQTMLDYQHDATLRCAILTGAGDKFFSAGADLKWSAEGGNHHPYDEYGPGGFAGISELWELSKPVVCALNGMAVGAGFEIALACDIIVAADHVKFWLPEVQRGFIAGAGGVIRLPRLMPYQFAMEMLLACRWVDAAELRDLRIVNSVVPAGQLLSTANAYAGKIAGAATLAVQATKACWHETAHMSIRDAFNLINTGGVAKHEEMKASSDYMEGSIAFAEKRPATWRANIPGNKVE